MCVPGDHAEVDEAPAGAGHPHGRVHQLAREDRESLRRDRPRFHVSYTARHTTCQHTTLPVTTAVLHSNCYCVCVCYTALYQYWRFLCPLLFSLLLALRTVEFLLIQYYTTIFSFHFTCCLDMILKL